jgi:hypothetical protein
MGKGANYVNQNKGVHLEKNKKRSDNNMPACNFGGGCNRPACIYRHPPSEQSKDACMAFMAGSCVFDAESCRKRHPPPHEVERLMLKYKRTKCRFAEDCKTKGCLFVHPGEELLPQPPHRMDPQQRMMQQHRANYYQQQGPPHAMHQPPYVQGPPYPYQWQGGPMPMNGWAPPPHHMSLQMRYYHDQASFMQQQQHMAMYGYPYPPPQAHQVLPHQELQPQQQEEQLVRNEEEYPPLGAANA